MCVQVAQNSEGDIPVYRHPLDNAPQSIAFTPLVLELVSRINRDHGLHLNHALIQLYRHGNDNISEHSDKTLDICSGSKIVNVSFGAKRYMTLRTKKTEDVSGLPRERFEIPLPHNSVFLLDLTANALYTHAIRPNKKLPTQQDPEESAYEGARISLTLREIGTFLTQDKRMFGTGATAKTRKAARPLPEHSELDQEWSKLIQAFGLENRSSVRNRHLFYGSGSDALK